MKKVPIVIAFALSLSLAASLLVSPAGAWISLPKWEATWGGPLASFESASDVAVAADGSVYVVGSTCSFSTGGAGDDDALILKYSATGSLLWARTWGDSMPDEAFGVAYVLRRELICVVGRTWSYGQGGSDAFILEFDSAGNLVWQQTWGGPGDDEALDVAVHPAGLIYVVGRTWSYGVYCDAFILGFSYTGTLFRQQTWGGNDIDVATALAVASNAVYMVGYSCSFGRPWVDDAFIVKFGILLGPPAWQETWGGMGAEDAFGVAVDSGGTRIYVVGLTQSYTPAGDFEAFILKLGPSGTLSWSVTWGGANSDAAGGVAVSGHDIYVVGETWSFPTAVRPAAFALHIDAAGTWIDDAAWSGSSGVVSASDVAVASKPSMGIYVAGSTYCSPPFSYLAPVYGNFGFVSSTLVIVAGSVTYPTTTAGHPWGNVQTPHGSTSYVPQLDATVINIWP